MAHKQVSHRNTKMPKKWQIIVCTHESKPFPRGLLHYTTLIMVNIVGPHKLGEGGNSSCMLSSCVLVYIVGHPIKLPMICNNIHLPTLFTKSVIGNQRIAVEYVAKKYFTFVMSCDVPSNPIPMSSGANTASHTILIYFVR